MAVRPFNSIAGISVGDPFLTVIQANGDITTINLTANGITDLGSISNVIITGGNNGEFITTDGNGNLTFANIDTSIISNGNSSVSIPVSAGNIVMSVNGAIGIATVTDSGINVAGYVNATGNLDVFNANLGNLVTANYIELNNDLTLSNGSITGVGNIESNTLTVDSVFDASTALSNLGPVANVTITGGSNGQALITDGNGNLSFGSVNADSNRAAPMPYLIPTGESYVVNENFQGLYAQPITIDGELAVDGILIEVGFSVNANDNQVYYDINGVPTGANGFTFNPGTNVFSTPGNIVASGDILPSQDITYSLGSNSYRWNNLYLSGNTIILGSSIITEDANSGALTFTNGDGGSLTVTGNDAVDTTMIANLNSNVKVLETAVTFNLAGQSNIAVLSNNAFAVGNIKTDNLLYANGSPWDLGGNPGGNNTYLQFNANGEFAGSANLTFSSVTNTLTVNGTANVQTLSVAQNALITGNLTVDGNLIYINVEELSVEDPIINLQTTANGSPPSSNTGKDVGTALNYYDTQARLAFMGWDVSNAEFAFGSQTTLTNEVVTFNTLGNLRAQTYKGNVESTTISGSLTTASQPNITNVGTLTSLTVSGNANVGNIGASAGIFTTVSGNGSALTSLTGGNVTGAVPYATVANSVAGANVTGEVSYAAIANSVAAANISGEVANATYANTAGSANTAGTVTTNAQPNITSVGTLSSLSVTGNVSAGNVNAGNVLSANYLVSNSGCVTINGGIIAYDPGTTTAGVFNSSASQVNIGFAGNVTLGSNSSTTTTRGNLTVNGSASVTGNISANLVSGTLSTNAQPNITSVGTLTDLDVAGNTITNVANANSLYTNSVISKRGVVAVTTLTVIDSFAANAYRTAKYVIGGQNDNGYESLEVLLVHNNINSYVTVYGAINDGGGNVLTLSTAINNGNVELRATGTAGNTEIRLVGTYIPII